jgi:hypothetical protein
MGQGHSQHRHSTVTRIIGLAIGGALILALALMNLTAGHFGFADTDGCACFVSYTPQPSNAACEPTRPQHCDQLWLGRLLVYLSHLDFNK